MAVNFKLLVIGLLTITSPGVLAQSKTLILTPQKVVDRMLAMGFEKKNLDLQRTIDSKSYYDAKGYFDFGFEAKTSFEQQILEPLGPFENEKEDTWSFGTTLLKPLGWGSTVKLEYTRDSIQRKLNPFLTSNNSLSTQTTDFVHLELEQNLLNNFAGGVYDRALDRQKVLEDIRDEKLLEATEDLVVDGLMQFWQTYTASENLTASIETRDRYLKLVSTSKKKQRLGFAAPGELARVEAEFESRDQEVKQYSADYLNALDSLFLLLGVEAPDAVQFEVGGEAIPDLPDLSPIDIERLRKYKIEKLTTRTMELNKKIVDSQQMPKLDLVARLSYRGADKNASETFSDLSGFNSPTYYAGLTFQTYLGSSAQQGARQTAIAEYKKSQLALEKQNIALKNMSSKAQRQVSAYYKIAISARDTVEIRTKALKQIEAAYSQGRLDVSDVITAFNELLKAKTRLTTSIGNYHIWRNLLASLRDELIRQVTEGLSNTSTTKKESL